MLAFSFINITKKPKMQHIINAIIDTYPFFDLIIKVSDSFCLCIVSTSIFIVVFMNNYNFFCCVSSLATGFIIRTCIICYCHIS